MDAILERTNGLALWLADHAAEPLTEFHAAFCHELNTRGVPVWRSSLGVEVLHPEQSGRQFIWRAEQAAVVAPAYHGVENSSDYLLSPARVVDESNQPYRRQLEGPILDMPMLEELRLNGGTDYLILPLPFLERSRSAFLSFATDAPGGFSLPDLLFLADAGRMFSPYAERRALRRLSIDLLETYVGHYAGERIFKGQIRRGVADTIEAAILMCDMRGFTALSNRAELQGVIDLLNEWFERVEAAVEAQDGEILEFMGDGLLAIFRTDTDTEAACERAYSAALEASASLSADFDAVGIEGGATIGFAMGLHVGKVFYGNVGGRHRLDFTVMGPAVNYASRLQGLAKRLNRRVLVSRDFALCLPKRVDKLGVFPLRGIGKAEQIYAAPIDASKAST